MPINEQKESREQRLINLVFSIGLSRLSSTDQDTKATWIAKQLRDSGFETKPAGLLHGILVNKPESDDRLSPGDVLNWSQHADVLYNNRTVKTRYKNLVVCSLTDDDRYIKIRARGLEIDEKGLALRLSKNFYYFYMPSKGRPVGFKETEGLVYHKGIAACRLNNIKINVNWL